MSGAAVLLALAIMAAPVGATARRRAGLVRAAAVSSDAVAGADDPMAVAASLDVFAVCLRAGMAVPTAASATALCAPPRLAAVLARAADLLALGADPATAWPVDDAPGSPTAALLRLARRSASSGAALADGVTGLADGCRRDAADTAAAAAERAGVAIAGPLGLCFLPAFVCVGLVPVIAGLAGEVLAPALV